MAHQRDISKIDKTILENFYKLVHSQEHLRNTAACSTFKILSALKRTKLDKFNENLNYCLDRLVAGLASSRACARRGYGTLLLQVLASFPVSTDRLFNIAKQKFNLISNETSRDDLLGYYVLIRIILETKNYESTKSNSKYLEIIYQHITKLQKIKAYFDYPTSELLSTHCELFHTYMAADIPPHAFGSDSEITHNELLNIVLCDRCQPIKELRAMDNSRFSKFFKTVKNDKLVGKPVHPLWLELGKFVIKHRPQQLKEFSEQVILATFFKANHNHLATIGLEIISKLINHIEDPNTMHILLPAHVVRVIIVASMTKKSPLKDSCALFLKELQQAQPLVLEGYIARMIELINSKLGIPSKSLIQRFAARQIGDIIRRPQLLDHHSLRQQVIKYLIVSCLFKPSPNKNTNSDNNKFWHSHGVVAPQRNSYENSVRKTLRSSLHKALYLIVRACKSLDRLDYLDDLIEFSNSLLQMDCIEYVGIGACNEGDETDGSNTTNQIQDLWSKYMSALNKHREVVERENQASKFCPITTLYLFYGLQLIEHMFDSSEQLEELAQSTKEVIEGDPNDGSWADVLTDQILAIMSATECTPWIRKLCVSLFGSLLPHVSETSIDLLRDAVQAPPDDDDEDDNDDDRDVPMDADPDQVAGGCSDEENEHETGNVNGSAKDLTSNQAIRRKKGKEKENGANEGKAKVKPDNDEDEEVGGVEVEERGEEEEEEGNEDEEDDEEYLDDEQMTKLDSVIAEMFKMRRKKHKDQSSASVLRSRYSDLMKKVKRSKLI